MYQKIISDINCHSDDKYSTKRGVYIVKTLKFRSENATKFFRRLDAVILTSDELDGKRVQRRRHVVPSTPRPSIFTKPPKGQPLDFYSPMWFNGLLPQQRMEIANNREVAFLPDARQSLMGKRLPSKTLSNRKFTQQFFDQLSQAYDLSHEIEDNNKEDVADEDDQAFVDDSDASNHGHEDTTKEDEEENDREARYNAMVLDEEL
ncbi:hypothetical protein PCANC_17036 [Puccinia coronata f. sp. avenae]|uniref:Uncharacterized protein n=1 Tax=Puccinia coronata f. sp. avenae TaxID=200324 RepID=A0A2N5SNZ5_9BASI|nr:hypothetical protein PCANC_17036 [Puccinia coronata f. sp. avenae]